MGNIFGLIEKHHQIDSYQKVSQELAQILQRKESQLLRLL